ncbi:Kelch-like protein 17 [Geodia barretti]|uniref:Kelch-like protein 17 n=1 Tax=Geodia barretti TaxID=519541 RepID=A0AA35S0W8_GEOBA|nr:Kelch-like protein 17 [Geodia barretti]
MFTSGMKESESGEVDIGEIPSNAVQDLVDFAYSSSLSLSYTSALQLTSAADMLQFSEVKQVCCEFLCSCLTPANCLELLQVADTYSCPELNRAASLCRNLNFVAVSEQEDFLELSLEHLEECLSSNHLCVSGEEEVVVEAALRWLDHDAGSRSRHAPRVLGCVRLSLLPPGVLVERVWPHVIVSGSPECMELVRQALSVQLSPATNTRPQQRRPYQVLCAIGGWDGDSVVHSVEWYDPHTARWKPGPSMNEPRKRLGVVAHCRKVYAVGGHNGKATLSSVEVYCQRSKRWTSLPNMSQARMFSGCVALNNRLDSWEIVPTTLPYHMYSEAVKCDEAIYILCGRTSSRHEREGHPSIYRYDPDTHQWAGLESQMPHPRAGFSAAVVNGDIVVVGGHRGREKLACVDLYDPAGEIWRRLPDMLGKGRCVLGAVAVDQLALL